MINSNDLKQSAVVFSEDTHTYRLGERKLSGITGLIHAVLRLGVYPEANQYVKEVQIPKAGHYGTCVHKAIQHYDLLGIDMTKFVEVKHQTQHYGIVTFDALDVAEDLEHYKRIKPKNVRTIASEFTVSAGNFASQIDAVWADEDDNIYLVDHKTNNLDYYPGGPDALKEYLSWQLSCYAEMFERQTGYFVKGLLGNWLRHGQGELWRIERQPSDKVFDLLQTELHESDHGFIYINEKMQVYDSAPTAVAPVDNGLVVAEEITSAIAEMLRAEKKAKDMKEKLREIMEQNGITKWENEHFTATIGAETTTTSLNTSAFKRDHKDLYEQYTKTTKRKGSFTLKLKD